MKPEKIAQLRSYVAIADRLSADALADLHGAQFGFRAGAYEMRLAGIGGTSTMSRDAAKASWIRAAQRKLDQAEAYCTSHVASATDSQVCGRCGAHIDDLRPPADDPINLAGSGPVPIEPREG